MMGGGGGGAVMIDDNSNLYVMRGNMVFKISKSDMKITGQTELPRPMRGAGFPPPRGGDGRPGGPGGGPGGGGGGGFGGRGGGGDDATGEFSAGGGGN